MHTDAVGFRTDTVEQLPERTPRTFENWCARNADAFLRKLRNSTTDHSEEVVCRARNDGIPVLFVQPDGGAGHRIDRGTQAWQIRQEITSAPSHRTTFTQYFGPVVRSKPRSVSLCPAKHIPR